ncbi:MAG: DUF2341 domain-containing protein [Pirellulales bacterium]
MRLFFLLAVVSILAGLPCALLGQESGWKHSGSLYILTTPEGANLAEGVTLQDFPLLIRLHQDFFDFSQAQPHGEDLRLFSASGEPLAYQIEEWNPHDGTASIWVRIPVIQGNARQAIQLRWGNPKAESKSSGTSVFNASNGYASVWHLTDSVQDDAEGTSSKDEGTTSVPGIIGKGRHLAGGQGIFGGEKIAGYPSGVGPMTTEVWFRAEKTNGTVIAWGEEKRPSKVMFNFLSPPRMAIQCYFADVEAKSRLATQQWYHVVHTYTEKDSRVYIDGQLDGQSNPVLDLPKTSRLWIGGWYRNYNFIGDVDEVRISKVARSPEWIRLQYENQKPMQTVVGPIVKTGDRFGLQAAQQKVAEGSKTLISAEADGAQKIYWLLKRDGQETVVATDRLNFEFHAGRVTQDQTATLQLKAVYPNEVKTQAVDLQIQESIPEPQFTLKAPATWDGRSLIEVVPQISNLKAMQDQGAGELSIRWKVANMGVVKEELPGKLLLKRSQNRGTLSITATISNGGVPTSATMDIAVSPPKSDAWVARTPAEDEKPEPGQFYARDDKNEGTLHYNGTLTEPAKQVFLKLYADEKLVTTETADVAANQAYKLSAKLKPGLIIYKVEFGTLSAGKETLLDTIDNLVCGDVYLIQGQSNALATDTGDKSPAVTSKWIRSFARANPNSAGPTANRWCYPVWKAREGEPAELGWWGMELAKQLVDRQQIPIFMVNGAVGGTRIDQHQRNDANPIDQATIYGRTLERLQSARLAHGVRGILWHQGENDQGADGPDGGYGWETYERYFMELAGDWQEDFPNVQHFYLFQIWPNSCAMGNGNGDMLREVQRKLPRLYSNMDVMSTLGVKPAGGCHFPLVGWGEFARLVRPLIERNHYQQKSSEVITPANLKRAYYSSPEKESVTLEFDQPVVWNDLLARNFTLGDSPGQVLAGHAQGNLLTLKLKEPSSSTTISYLSEKSWNPEQLLFGINGIAALSFCRVPLEETGEGK